MNTAKSLAKGLAVDQDLSRTFHNPSPSRRFLSLANTDSPAVLIDCHLVRYVHKRVDISLELVKSHLNLLGEE
jgi:hypothetical protein